MIDKRGTKDKVVLDLNEHLRAINNKLHNLSIFGFKPLNVIYRNGEKYVKTIKEEAETMVELQEKKEGRTKI